MMAENSHLISEMPERETGLPNTYSGDITRLLVSVTYAALRHPE